MCEDIVCFKLVYVLCYVWLDVLWYDEGNDEMEEFFVVSSFGYMFIVDMDDINLVDKLVFDDKYYVLRGLLYCKED